MDAIDSRRASLEQRFPRWPEWTLAGALDAAAAEFPERPFVITDERTMTYREVAERSQRLARGLVAAGVGRGDNVALLLPNGADIVALFFAIARAGAAAVPINPLLREREIAYLLHQSDSVGLVACEHFRDIDHAAVLDALAPGWRDGAGGHLRLVAMGEGSTVGQPLERLERDPDPRLDGELARRAPRADDPATIFYTSGTTGSPKGVVLTHDMELRSAYGSALTRGFEDGRRILFALPLNHVFAYIEGLLASLFVGGAAIIQARFDPHDTLRAIERHRANEALFVPTMSLAVVEAAGSTDTSSLHSVMSAAAPAPARLWRQLVEELGVEQLVTAYGMTETSAATTFTMPGDSMERLVETVGRPKFGGVAGELVEYKLVDGELVARGSILTRGYYRKPEETKAALAADGWLRSGDLGTIDDAGYLRLTGRSKELYKCGGELVMPQEVEARLTDHPDVSQAHVVGVPDERMGEVGYAFVVTAEGRAPSADELIEHCRGGLARWKVPAEVRFLGAAELPLTASGKVQKYRLLESVRADRSHVARPAA